MSSKDPNQYVDTSRIVETRIGKFEYIGGYPTYESVQRAYEHLDIQRAAQVYLEFMPFMSQQAIFRSHTHESGLRENGDMGVYDYQAEAKVNAVGLTYNTESIYMSAILNVENGPVVIESPPNILGVIDDGWMRYIADMGNAGPDKGQGGKYLLVYEGYEGQIPEGYFVFRTPTYRNWIMARAFVSETGEGESALHWYQENMHIYSETKGAQSDSQYLSFSQQEPRTTHWRDFRFYEELAEAIQYEPSTAFTPYELGLLKSLGIERGKPFSPDTRLKDLMIEGIAIGDAMAKSNAYANRLQGVRRYPDRKYEYLFLGGRYDFMSGDALWLDARLLFHYEAIVVTPAMAVEMVGVGSQYLACYRDTDGDYLMGDNEYRLHLPPDIPAKDFWSVTAYHPETRSLLANGEKKPAKNSYDDLQWNEDRSVDIYFGPSAPEGLESNWIKTLPNQGWEILFRLYGPLESYFDKSWKPDDIDKIS